MVALALLAYSYAFSAPFCVPKLLILGVGLLEMSIRVIRTGEINSGLVIPGLAFILACILSTIFSADPLLSIMGRYNSYALGLIGIAVCFLYYLAGDSRLLYLAGPVMGLHAFHQWASGESPIVGRAIGTAGSPVDLGIILAMLAPLQKSNVCLFAVVLGLLATGSRGAWLAAAAGLYARRLNA